MRRLVRNHLQKLFRSSIGKQNILDIHKQTNKLIELKRYFEMFSGENE